jgi:hypothetical protein
MRWSELVGRVREYGRYAGTEESRQIIRGVLWEFGGHLPRDLRTELAERLPRPAAAPLTDALPATRRLTGAEFVDSVARHTREATAATARWDVSSVLGVIADLAGDDLVERIVAALPPGYALLFGRAELTGADRQLTLPASSSLRRVLPTARPSGRTQAGEMADAPSCLRS